MTFPINRADHYHGTALRYATSENLVVHDIFRCSSFPFYLAETRALTASTSRYKDVCMADASRISRHCHLKWTPHLSTAGDLWVNCPLPSLRTDELKLFSWEYLQSLHVEYSFIRGRLGFRLPVVSGHALLSAVQMMIDQDPLHGWTGLRPYLSHCAVSHEGPWLER